MFDILDIGNHAGIIMIKELRKSGVSAIH